MRCTAYSVDGRLFAYASPEKYHTQVNALIRSVKIVNASSGALQHTLPIANVHELSFSPKGSYLNTWERPWKNDEDGQAGKNSKVWDTTTGEMITEFVQKSQNGWSLQYTQDEKYCCRNVTNEVHIFESANIQNGMDTCDG